MNDTITTTTIAAGRHVQFARLFLGGAFFVAVLAAGAVFTAALKRQPLAYEYGKSACVFASDAACAPAYARIFLQVGASASASASAPAPAPASASASSSASSSREYLQGDALADVFVVFGPTVGLQMIFLLLRAGLATCHDFAFLAKASFGALLLVYLPAILLAHYVFRVAAAYYIAMYVPHFALLAVFGARMAGHLRAMLAATEDAPAQGPWTQHTLRMTMNGSPAPVATPPVAAARDLEQRGTGGDSMRAPLIHGEC